VPPSPSWRWRDCHFEFWGEHTKDETGTLAFPADLRLLAKVSSETGAVTVDLTGTLSEELGRRIEQRGDIAIAEYLAAVDAWLELRERDGLSESRINQERAKAHEICQRRSLGRLLKQLGDASIGIDGCLHPLNYVFRDIGIDALSLRDLLGAHAVSADAQIQALLWTTPGVTRGLLVTSESWFSEGDDFEGELRLLRRSNYELRRKLRTTGPLLQNLVNAADNSMRALSSLADLAAALRNQEAMLAQLLTELRNSRPESTLTQNQ
jgi:hypothetical protein